MRDDKIRLLTEAVLWTGRGGAFVGLCGWRGLTEAPEGGLKKQIEIQNFEL